MVLIDSVLRVYGLWQILMLGASCQNIHLRRANSLLISPFFPCHCWSYTTHLGCVTWTTLSSNHKEFWWNFFYLNTNLIIVMYSVFLKIRIYLLPKLRFENNSRNIVFSLSLQLLEEVDVIQKKIQFSCTARMFFSW